MLFRLAGWRDHVQAGSFRRRNRRASRNQRRLRMVCLAARMTAVAAYIAESLCQKERPCLIVLNLDDYKYENMFGFYHKCFLFLLNTKVKHVYIGRFITHITSHHSFAFERIFDFALYSWINLEFSCWANSYAGSSSTLWSSPEWSSLLRKVDSNININIKVIWNSRKLYLYCRGMLQWAMTTHLQHIPHTHTLHVWQTNSTYFVGCLPHFFGKGSACLNIFARMSISGERTKVSSATSLLWMKIAYHIYSNILFVI